MQGSGELEKRVLKVNMLGDLQVMLNDKEVELPGGIYSKTTRLFLLTVFYREKGIQRQNILEMLYGEGEYADDSGSLRVAVFRLKKYLMDAGILTKEGSIYQKGIFKLCEEGLRVVMDVEEFEAAAMEAFSRREKDEQIKLLETACQIYRGDFLPALSGELWVAGKQAAYQNLYFRCMHRYLELLSESKQYGKILSLTKGIIRMYPYEEWYVAELDALIGMERWKEAKEAADQAVQSLMDHMGVHPSRELEEQMKKITNHLNGSTRNLMEIQKELEENVNNTGAFYCSYPSFVGVYQYEMRKIERTGESLYLMLCSITEKEGVKAEESYFEKAIEHLGDAIRMSMRRADVYTRYGPNQYLMLLEGFKQEDCPVISARIESNFGKEQGMGKFRLHYFIVPVITREEQQESKPIKFNQKGW